MNLATKDTISQVPIITQNAAQKAQCPPPESVSAIVKKNQKFAVTPCDLYEGARVEIHSSRENLSKHNGRVGIVEGVIYPRDCSRSIIYVEIPGIKPQPTFWYSELKPVAPQATVKEVQSCQ